MIGVLHAQRLIDRLAHVVVVRLPGHLLNQGAEHDIAGVAVKVACAGRKFEGSGGEQLQVAGYSAQIGARSAIGVIPIAAKTRSVRQKLVDGNLAGIRQVTIVGRDWRVEFEFPIGHQAHDGYCCQHLCDGSDVEFGIGLIRQHVRMNCIAARRRKNGLIVTCDEHGAGELIGGCLSIQHDLHFFD